METIKIFPYDEKYKVLYKKYETLIKPFAASVEFIGSASAKLSGKKEIDILVIAKPNQTLNACMDACAAIGFAKGPIDGGEGYMKAYVEGIAIELHILPPNHYRAESYYKVLAKLHQEEHAKNYEAMKWAHNGKPMATYKLAKTAFFSSLFPKVTKKRRKSRRRGFTRDHK